MKRGMILSLAVLCGTLTISQGCSRLIDEGVEKALGPTPKVMFQTPLPPSNENDKFLSAYKNFVLGKVDTSQFEGVPQKFLDYLPIRFSQQIRGKGLPTDPKGKTLVINVTILAYQPVSSYSKALGPTEEVVARVELVDKDTNKIVGKAVCIGRTYQSIGLGEEWKAWGLCRAIVNKWINIYYPDEGRVEEDDSKEPPPPKE